VAAPVTEPAVLQIEFGDRFLSELRAALEARPRARRFLIGAASVPAFMRDSDAPVSVAGLPISDTCKEVVEGFVRRTVPRENLVTLTGPWVVSRDALTGALDRLASGSARDPLELFRSSGLPIHVSTAS
jgi:2-C-methyl-D-erythritol 4-phosphate cytidylyltransferase